MAYDIHLALTEESASVQNRVFGIEEEIHEFIFSTLDGKQRKYVLFCRMKDYYKDAIFKQSELASLQDELLEIRKLFGGNQLVLPLLEMMISSCNEADSKNLKIYCFCD